MLNDDVLSVNTAATAKGNNCDVTAAAGMMSSVTQKCGIPIMFERHMKKIGHYIIHKVTTTILPP